MVDTFPANEDMLTDEVAAKPFFETLLAQSRTRCEEAYRLDRGRRAGPSVLSPGELKCLTEPLELLTRIARPELEALLARLAPANYVVVLSDANGVAIDFVANGEPDRKLWRMGVCAGATWGEPHVGTNGIGTCIMSGMPIIVHQRNHFLLKYSELTCAAAPLFDAKGRVIASLDASSVADLPQEVQGMVLELVVQTARRIERRYFLERHRNISILTIDQASAALHTNPGVMLAVNEDGCVIDMQGAASDGSDAELLARYQKLNFTTIMKSALQTPSVQAGHSHIEHKTIISLDGESPHFSILRTPSPRVRTYPCASRTKEPPARTLRRRPLQKPVLDLDRLAGEDPSLRGVVDKIDRFITFKLPFLIQGETGTGKEEFARAIHTCGTRTAAPFVAIDCSSIPENLIESELFGYEAGTFTGAKRDGRRGRLLDANGGTLFLDEIGDMPLTLQTRLLRVLAQNEIVPLGGHQPIKVEFNLICATHQDLKTMVDEKRFRQDLYYRIAGCRIELPPLRERSDKDHIITVALEMECDAAGTCIVPNISQDALDILHTHPWPGNMRQLRLSLRYALACCCGGDEILAEHLPDDILDASPFESNHRSNSALLNGNLEDALRRNAWSVSKTARDFKVSRQTVHRWMKERNLKRPAS